MEGGRVNAFYLTKERYQESLQNKAYEAIRAELLEIDQEIAQTVDMTSLVGSQRPPEGFLPSQHWSRVFEYPWVIEQLSKRGRLGASMGVTNMKILDVGSGISPLPVYLSRHGAEVTGLDAHPVSLPGICTVKMDARRWEGQGQVDAITCISTVEHIPGVNLVKLFSQWLYENTRRMPTLLITLDIPLTRSPFGVEPLAFADLIVWLCRTLGPESVPQYPGYHKMLNSSDSEQGEIVGTEIGIFCLEL